jgi:hypothetical protein
LNALDKTLSNQCLLDRVSLDLQGRLRIPRFTWHHQGTPLARARKVTITLDPFKLLFAKIRPLKINIQNLQLRFVRDYAGTPIWSKLKPQKKEEVPTRPSENADIWGQGLLTIGDLNVIVQTKTHDMLSLRNLKTQKTKFEVFPQGLRLKGIFSARYLKDLEVSFQSIKGQMDLKAFSPSLKLQTELFEILPPKIRQALPSFKTSGQLALQFRYLKSPDFPESRMTLNLQVGKITFQPPGFALPFALTEGRLYYLPQKHQFEADSLRFQSLLNATNPLIRGKGQWKANQLQLQIEALPQKPLLEKMPAKIRSFLEWTQPEGPLKAKFWCQSSGVSGEIRFRDQNLKGIKPRLSHVTGVVTLDHSVNRPLKGHIYLSSLSCLGLFFNHGQIPFESRDGVFLGSATEPLVLEGPWIYLEGQLQGKNKHVMGEIDIKGLDLASWIDALKLSDTFKNYNGVINGRLHLNAAKDSPHDKAIGQFDFQWKDSSTTISSYWFSLGKIFRPQDLILLPFKMILGKKKKENLNLQEIYEGKGHLEIFPNKFVIENTRLYGAPFHFSVKGKVRFSNSGKLRFSPRLIPDIPIDPTRLLEVVPLIISWDKDKVKKE